MLCYTDCSYRSSVNTSSHHPSRTICSPQPSLLHQIRTTGRRRQLSLRFFHHFITLSASSPPLAVNRLTIQIRIHRNPVSLSTIISFGEESQDLSLNYLEEASTTIVVSNYSFHSVSLKLPPRLFYYQKRIRWGHQRAPEDQNAKREYPG